MKTQIASVFWWTHFIITSNISVTFFVLTFLITYQLTCTLIPIYLQKLIMVKYQPIYCSRLTLRSSYIFFKLPRSNEICFSLFLTAVYCFLSLHLQPFVHPFNSVFISLGLMFPATLLFFAATMTAEGRRKRFGRLTYFFGIPLAVMWKDAHKYIIIWEISVHFNGRSCILLCHRFLVEF